MNNAILEMDVVEAFAEYETLCAIGDCINKQILMEYYIQEADNAPATDNIPAPDVTTFQKFKNWVSRIVTLIKRNMSKFSRAFEKWLTRGIMSARYEDHKNGKKIKVPKYLLDCMKFIINEDHVKRIFAIIGYTVPDISDYRKWLTPVVRYYQGGDYVSLKSTLDREIKKSNPYFNKLVAMQNGQGNMADVEVKFDEFSKDIKALQQKSDDMSNSIKEVSRIIGDEKSRIPGKDKKFDQYVAAMTSLMKWLLVQSNLILYIGMLIPLISTTEDTIASNPQVKKIMESIRASHISDKEFDYDNMSARAEKGKILISVPPKDENSGKKPKTFTAIIKTQELTGKEKIELK